ncbi:MAG: heme-binding protein, partial [Planctomycetaceae bacterium]|nr:heme-binding protein [Planctomycetaceae bacterium]
MIADPTKSERDPERIRVYCNEVKNCQGILPLNGEVFVTCEGPDGNGLYRLADQDQDGLLEVQQKLASFKGESLEHGAHGLRLGPDGMLYVIIGNGSQLVGMPDIKSPYQFFYEGDLIPRFEDPGGHASGVAAPGGTIVRVSLDGTRKEIVAGGIRNAYDLVFDAWGELFFHDSDMESDMGSNWYRPTMVFHVPDGAEFGWRSGWSKFPQYYVDQMPAICETGRGSPTGAVLYQHTQFPESY